MPDDIRGWLTEALSRRTRHPELERTLFHRLEELERGPMEQLGELVRAVVEELRFTQDRLTDQTRDLYALRGTVAVMGERLDELASRVPAPPQIAEGYALFLPSPDGYVLVARDGAPPAPGDQVEHDGGRYRVLNRGHAGLPGGLPTVLALPE